MKNPALIIMAAGMGSRYGGLKQIEKIGPGGEIIMDYSVYDAMQAGFDKIVFVIKKENEKDFRAAAGDRIAQKVDVRYAFQRLEDLPEGFSVPEGRVKPWGTGHAVLACRDLIDSPFAVINADDYYGAQAFSLLYKELMCEKKPDAKLHFCMAGYRIENTLTENGHVARGICAADAEGMLTEITERVQIQRKSGKIVFTENGTDTVIPEGTPVSMNCWGFPQEMLLALAQRFPKFLEESKQNPLKAEYFLPFVVDALIREGKADVRVLPTAEKWYGVTYREDRENVVKAISEMVKKGKYPEKL